MPRLTTALSIACALSVLAAPRLPAKGGPPMFTDDPGTPGNGRFELNLGGTFEGDSRQQSWTLPTFDLNYGVGPSIQLNLATSFVLQKDSRGGPVGGLGAASAAVKWRFLDQGSNGYSVSVFRRIERSVLRSSVRRGLADGGTRFFLPLEVTRTFGRINLDFEIGSLLSTLGRSEWSYGFVAGTAVTSRLDLMAELHGDASASFTSDRLTLNVGLRHEFNPAVALIASLRHDLRAAPGTARSLVGYCGCQFGF